MKQNSQRCNDTQTEGPPFPIGVEGFPAEPEKLLHKVRSLGEDSWVAILSDYLSDLRQINEGLRTSKSSLFLM